MTYVDHNRSVLTKNEMLRIEELVYDHFAKGTNGFERHFLNYIRNNAKGPTTPLGIAWVKYAKSLAVFQMAYWGDGYDTNGVDSKGFNKLGKHFVTNDIYDDDGYDVNGYDINGFDKNGRDKNGLDQNGLDKDGYNQAGYDSNGLDRKGFDANGKDVEGFDCYGLKNGHNREWYKNGEKYIINPESRSQKDKDNIAGLDEHGMRDPNKKYVRDIPNGRFGKYDDEKVPYGGIYSTTDGQD